MRIWFDCNTSKQALLFSTIAKRIKKKGHDYLLTCRDYDVAPSLLHEAGVQYKVIGEHGGGALGGKLLASTERMNLLAKYLVSLNEQKRPDFTVYLNSPEAARVSFGLAIPSACFNDTPHAKATITLVVPFSDHVILPGFIPLQPYLRFVPREKIYRYNGIDAVEIFRDFKPDKNAVSDLNLDRSQGIVLFRPEEAFASYYPSSGDNPLPKAEKLLKNMISAFPRYQFVVMPRYKEQRKRLEHNFGKKIIIPKKAVDTRSLEAFSDLVITGGSTLAEEAAIQGTPSISYYPRSLYRWRWLKERGFPGFHLKNLSDAIDKGFDILNDPEKYKLDTSPMLEDLQAPGDILLDILEERRK